MKVVKLQPSGFAANSYLLTEDGKTAVAVDPSSPSVLEEAAARGLFISHALLTHGHFDHIGGCAALQRAGAKIGCLEGERELALRHNLGEEFGFAVPPFQIDFTFRGGETLNLGGMRILVIASAGHTAGSCCFLAGGALFTGDTLFRGDVGRTDLPTGSARALEESVRRLYALEGDYPVYAGHGEDTTLARERTHNGAIRV